MVIDLQPRIEDSLDKINPRIEEVYLDLFETNNWETVVEDFCDELVDKLHNEMKLDFFEAISIYFPNEIRDQVDDVEPVTEAIKAILDKYETKYLTS